MLRFEMSRLGITVVGHETADDDARTRGPVLPPTLA
jgi:hypothetical protein